MKHHITIKLIIFCALFLGVGQFSALNTARATPSQVHTGGGVVLHYRHHVVIARHTVVMVVHPRVVVMAAQIDNHSNEKDRQLSTNSSQNLNYSNQIQR
jgi:hypothetical protein